MFYLVTKSEDKVADTTSACGQPITTKSCSSNVSSIDFENFENVSKMLIWKKKLHYIHAEGTVHI